MGRVLAACLCILTLIGRSMSLIRQERSERIHQSRIPVDGDFVGAEVGLEVMPVGSEGMRATDKVTGPGRIVDFGAAVVRVERRVEAKPSDKGTAVAIATEEVVERIE